MSPRRALLLGAALLLLPACSQLQLASAGQTACPPKAIQISQVERGWSSESWVATCGGATYRCSSLATAWATDYSCTRDGAAEGGVAKDPAAADAGGEAATAGVTDAAQEPAPQEPDEGTEATRAGADQATPAEPKEEGEAAAPGDEGGGATEEGVSDAPQASPAGDDPTAG